MGPSRFLFDDDLPAYFSDRLASHMHFIRLSVILEVFEVRDNLAPLLRHAGNDQRGCARFRLQRVTFCLQVQKFCGQCFRVPNLGQRPDGGELYDMRESLDRSVSK